MAKFLKSLFGGGDINLPDERKGKSVRSVSGGTTKGGAPDDARWLTHNKRKSDQAIGDLKKLGETVRKFTGRKK